MQVKQKNFVSAVCIATTLCAQFAAGENNPLPEKDSKMNEIAPQIAWTPEGKPENYNGWMNGYARGLELILRKQGHETNFDMIMGDLGLAFIMQGEENTKNRINGAVDVGWWPLEPVAIIRLNFLQSVAGHEIIDLKLSADEVKSGGKSAYYEKLHPAIKSSIEKQIPCLARIGSAEYLITGFDTHDEFPLIGMCPNEKSGNERIYRIEEPLPPYVVLTLGSKVEKLDRRTADKEALRFAVALHNDEVIGPESTFAGKWQLRRTEEYGKSWRTGKKSIDALIACLSENENFGKPFWYANVKKHLVRNRESAINYLKHMQERYTGEAAAHLSNAASQYAAVIEKGRQINTSKEVINSNQGRVEIVSLLNDIKGLEGEAIAEIEQALKAM